MYKGLMHHNDGIFIEKFPNKKLPVLTVHIGNEVYKVASFNSEKTAYWFQEFCEEFFDEIAINKTKGET